MPVHTADWLFALSNVAAIVGGILVVLGAAGIFFFGGIREHHSNEKMATLNAKTAEAQRNAAEAHERAAQTNRDSDAIRLELERERAERLKLEQKMAPRRVSAELRRDIQTLARPDEKTKLYFQVAINNAEGDRFINEFGAACVEAGWPRDRLGGATVAGADFPPGVTVCVNPEQSAGLKLPAPAGGLVAALVRAGLAGAQPLAADASVPMDTVQINAGLKPD